jgi:dynein heavy chain
MVQDDFEKMFAAINKVRFDDNDRKMIVDIYQVMGKFEECLTLHEGVHAEGNIEEWLVKLQNEMQRSVRGVAQRGCQDCFSLGLKDFVAAYPSQIALLGIQRLWTDKVEECLEKSQKEKLQELEKKKREVIGIMDTLSNMCLEDMNKLVRQKTETLVTIHVHQRDVFLEIQDLCKQHKIKDKNDFEW